MLALPSGGTPWSANIIFQRIACNHEQGLCASVACSRLLDSGEDVKVKGARKRGRIGKKEKGRSFLSFYFYVCAFSIQHTRLSRSLEEANASVMKYFY